MKPLWAPWRMAYIEEEKPSGCIFCDKPREKDSRAALILAQTAHSIVMLNKYPYNNGHLLIAPKRHEKTLAALPEAEYRDACDALKTSLELLERSFRPGGFNIGMNLGCTAGAGVEHHLHWHIVPRWEGDTNFMPVIGETRVIPQHLLDNYDRLSPMFRDALGAEHARGA
jgi:ATP adenylyltransferase